MSPKFAVPRKKKDLICMFQKLMHLVYSGKFNKASLQREATFFCTNINTYISESLISNRKKGNFVPICPHAKYINASPPPFLRHMSRYLHVYTSYNFLIFWLTWHEPLRVTSFPLPPPLDPLQVTQLVKILGPTIWIT